MARMTDFGQSEWDDEDSPNSAHSFCEEVKRGKEIGLVRREPLNLRHVGTRRPERGHDVATPSVVSTVPPAWCDRRPPESCSRTLNVARRSSAPGSVARAFRELAGGGNTRGDVAVCVRLRPGAEERCCEVQEQAVKLRQIGSRYDSLGEAQYQFDHVFGEECAQEEVFNVAVAPICEAVLSGYNGAVIAYGQTGSGKTHTVVGNNKFRGVAPRAVHCVFQGLAQSPMWSVDVSVLEIYNERVRDLLSAGSVTHVDVHEVRSEHEGGLSFRCPDAVRRQAQSPEEALGALQEGMKRRETARTDMNHHSSRSHLIFTLTATQRDPEIGATLRGRLHLVDLAGSERLKRSMSEFSPRGQLTRRGSGSLRTPRDQRREAGEINKSLSQLALVIQRLTQTGGSLQLVPYRDSMLTRLLAESFGGSSKTCLIITCSMQAADREETRCSLEFGKRAKLVRNKPQINLEVAHEPSAVVEAFVAKKLEEMQRVQEELLREQELLHGERALLQGRVESLEEKLREAVQEIHGQQNSRLSEATQLEDQKAELREQLRSTLSSAVADQDATARQLERLESSRRGLQRQLEEAHASRISLRAEMEEQSHRHQAEAAQLRAMLADRQRNVEDATKQAAELRSSLAELGKENAWAKSQWLSDISRWEAEKLALVADYEAKLQARWPEECAEPEAECPARTEEESFDFTDLQLRSSELKQQLQAITSDSEELEKLRQARLLCLEVEAQDLQAKWHLESKSTDSEDVEVDPEPVLSKDEMLKALNRVMSNQDAPNSPPATRLHGAGLLAWEATSMPLLIPTSGGA